MSWSRIQGAGNDPSGQSSAAVTLNGVVAGHQIVVYVVSNQSTVTVSDGSNSYTLIGSYGQFEYHFLYRAIAGTSGNLTITASESGSPTGIYAEEWSFAGGTPSASATATGMTNGGTAISAGPITFAGNGLSVAVIGVNSAGGTPGTVTPGAGYTLESNFAPSGTSYGLYTIQKANTTTGSETPSATSASNTAAGMIGVVFSETPSDATLSGPTSGAAGSQSTAFTVTLDAPAIATVTVTPASSVTGDTFQATSGGSNVTSITIAAGATTGTLYITPTSTAGSRNITATAAGITFSNGPWAYDATGAAATGYTISGATPGLVGGPITVTVTPNGAVASDTVTITSTGSAGTLWSTSLTFTNSSAAQSVTWTPSAAGTATLTFHSSSSLTLSGSPLSISATTGVSFDSWVSGLPSGQSSSATAVPRIYNGSSIASLTSGTYSVGPIVESSDQAGAYGCRVTVAPAHLPAGSTLRVAWTVGGTSIVDPSPQPASSLLDGGLSWGQALNQALAGLAGILGNVPTSGPGTLYFGGTGTSSNNRIAMGVDGSGNRTSVTHSPPIA